MMVLSSCASVPPKNYNFQSSRIINKNYDEVWAAIISSFAENNTPIKTIEKDSGIIVSDDLKVPFKLQNAIYYSDYCDCGHPGGLNMYKQMLGSYNIFARKIENEQTSIQINTNFKASMWYGNNFIDWVTCSSKGLFEGNLLSQVESRLNISKGMIGVQLWADNIVKSVIEGSPAEEVGLLAGDQIITVDGKEVTSLGETLSYLSGAPDTKVGVTILRKGKPIEYVIRRRAINITDNK